MIRVYIVSRVTYTVWVVPSRLERNGYPAILLDAEDGVQHPIRWLSASGAVS